MAPLEMTPIGFPFWVAVLALMAGLSQDAGSGGIFRGRTGSWLLALTLDLGSVALQGTGWFLEGNVLTRMVHAQSTMQMRNAKIRASWVDVPLALLTKQYGRWGQW